MKWIILFCTLYIAGCKNLDFQGNYAYTKEELSEKHRNEIIMTYSGTFKKLPFKAKQKIQHDPIYGDKPAYYEASYEIWFW